MSRRIEFYKFIYDNSGDACSACSGKLAAKYRRFKIPHLCFVGRDCSGKCFIFPLDIAEGEKTLKHLTSGLCLSNF